MLTVLKAASLAAVVSIGLVVGQAQAATVNWGAEGGPNNFDNASIMFTGFNADTLVGVTGPANYTTNNGSLNPSTFKLDILLDGVWTNIFTDETLGTSSLEANVSNISFAYGEITGLRGSATGQGATHVPLTQWAGGPGFIPTIFTFEAVDPPAPVPLPAAAWFLLSALGGLGFAGWRRRKTAA